MAGGIVGAWNDVLTTEPLKARVGSRTENGEEDIPRAYNTTSYAGYENKPVGGPHFHMDGFACRVVLAQRQKATHKWPTVLLI